MISVDQKVDEEIMQGARQNLCALEKIFALSQNMQGNEALSDLTSDQHMAIVLRHLNIESRSVHPPYDIFSGTDALMEEFESTIGDELLLKNLCDAVEKCTDLIFGSLPTLVNSTEQLPFSIEQMLACLTWYIESIERAVGARKSDVDMVAEEQKVLSIQENHLHQIDAIVAKYAQLYGIFDIIHCPIPGAHHLLGLVYNLGLFLQPSEAEKLLEKLLSVPVEEMDFRGYLKSEDAMSRDSTHLYNYGWRLSSIISKDPVQGEIKAKAMRGRILDKQAHYAFWVRSKEEAQRIKINAKSRINIKRNDVDVAFSDSLYRNLISALLQLYEIYKDDFSSIAINLSPNAVSASIQALQEDIIQSGNSPGASVDIQRTILKILTDVQSARENVDELRKDVSRAVK